MNNYKKLRQDIIIKISNYFLEKEYVYACWLGGADSNNEVDEYSDIDLFLGIKDLKTDYVFNEVEKLLKNFGNLDFISNIKIEGNQKIKFFHVNNTSENLIIDIGIIEESYGIIFEENHPFFKPKIIFDKNNFIKITKFNEEKLLKNISIYFKEQEDLFFQRARIKSYINRKNYIEATNYYLRFMYLPLIAILRIKYTPKLYNWGRIHISRHLPSEIIKKLEKLMKFNSIEDIDKNLKVAEKWFLEISNELKINLQKNEYKRNN